MLSSCRWSGACATMCKSEPAGLYLHVPFCRRKCPYCDFYSVSGADAACMEAYQQAVCRNLRWYGNGAAVDSIYFGGGTPSLLPPDVIRAILTEAAACFSVQEPEVTLEVNPATVTAQQIRAYREAGVNRLSIGVQSLIPEELVLLGRLHTAEAAKQTVWAAAQAGFSNLSCDLMLGTPGQTADSLERTLNQLLELPIVHLSAYLLKVEPGTPYAAQHMEQQAADEDMAADLYLQTVNFLEQNGFLQYEVSNFAKPGFESRHNCKYWRCVPYLGIGPSAHSCWNGKRFFVQRDLAAFLQDAVQTEQLEDAAPCTLSEQIMLGMRLRDGMPLSVFSDAQRVQLHRFAAMGLLRLQAQRVSFTPEGFLVSNAVLAALL